MGKCRNRVNMPESNFNICNLQVNYIVTDSKYEYKFCFSLETNSEFDK